MPIVTKYTMSYFELFANADLSLKHAKRDLAGQKKAAAEGCKEAKNQLYALMKARGVIAIEFPLAGEEGNMYATLKSVNGQSKLEPKHIHDCVDDLERADFVECFANDPSDPRRALITVVAQKVARARATVREVVQVDEKEPVGSVAATEEEAELGRLISCCKVEQAQLVEAAKARLEPLETAYETTRTTVEQRMTTEGVHARKVRIGGGDYFVRRKVRKVTKRVRDRDIETALTSVVCGLDMSNTDQCMGSMGDADFKEGFWKEVEALSLEAAENQVVITLDKSTARRAGAVDQAA
jgi:hypothetical protein